MSLDTRLSQGIMRSATELEARSRVDVEGALGSVRIGAARRQKTQLIAIGLIALGVALIALRMDDVGRILNAERTLPPAERGVDDDGEGNTDGDPRNDISFGFGTQTDEGIAPWRGETNSASRGRLSRTSSNQALGSASRDAGTRSGATRWRERTEEEQYRSTSDPFTDATGCWATRLTCYVEFQAEPQDRMISVVILDSQSQTVRGEIFLDRDGNGEVDNEGIEFCSETDSPIRILGGSPVHVRVTGVGCSGWMGGTSSGRVKITFFGLRPS